MRITFYTRYAEKLKGVHNFLKIPLDFVDISELSSVNLNRCFCIITTEPLDATDFDVPVIYTKNVIRNNLTDVVNNIPDVNTLDSIVMRLLNTLPSLKENDDFYETPLLNEIIIEFEFYLRDLFAKYNLPYIKIDYLPCGYSWGMCISHDVDTLSVKEHGFDMVMVKSLASAYVEFLFGYRTLKSAFRYSYECLKCLLLDAKDPLYNIEEWLQFENKLPSTFYFALENGTGIKYSHEQVESCMNLLKNNFEIGMHGQCHSLSDAIKKEVIAFTKISGKRPAGIRMHYLRFNKYTWDLLENAGYVYDCTYGYNQKIGYKSGTVMPYIVPDTPAGTLVEIPLHIMDTTLFNIFYMNLSIEDGISITKKAINEVKKHNGILSVLIHQRSITKHFMRYRDWYMWLRDLILNDSECWIVNGEEVAKWHKEWFDLKFDYHVNDDYIYISLNKRMKYPLCVDIVINGYEKKIKIPVGKNEICIYTSSIE